MSHATSAIVVSTFSNQYVASRQLVFQIIADKN